MKKLKPKSRYPKLPRANRVTILLNDKELEAVKEYAKMYKIDSLAKVFRETTMRSIIKQLEDNQPTLFDD